MGPSPNLKQLNFFIYECFLELGVFFTSLDAIGSEI
jgi:hypothetical protein